MANSITDGEVKRSVLLTVIGAPTYAVLRSLVSPDKLEDKSYQELVDKLTDHYSPKPSETVERFKFHSRFREPGESVMEFIAKLRALAEHCNFGVSLEDMLRDRLVCGVNDAMIQKWLLAEPKLTYAKAVELTRGLETADKNLKLLSKGKSKQGAESLSTASSQAVLHTQAGSKGARKNPSTLTCYRCGQPGHTVAKCQVSKEVICHHCKIKGHLQRACKKRQRGIGPNSDSRPVCHLEGEMEEAEDEEAAYPLFHVTAKSSRPPLEVQIKVDDQQVLMEIDTGATFSLMSETTLRSLWPRRSLVPTEVRLCSYLKDPIPVIGQCYVNIAYKGQGAKQVPLIIVQGSGPTLLGRNWLQHVRLDWHSIHQTHSDALQTVLDRYPEVFKEELGTLKGYKATIRVDPNATPKFHKPRTVPYALRDKVEAELKRLQEEGTLEPVEVAEWAAPIVTVLKSDKSSVRICGDFRVTVNPVSKLDSYPLPRAEDLFATLHKGRSFTKLDLSQAYQQLPLDEESKKYVVINTHKGLFRYTRLPYGISSAPGIFQRVLENLLQGIPQVGNFIDDIIITGSMEAEHLKALEEVLQRLDKAGLRIRLSKCEFMKPEIDYLGHKIDKHGLHPLPDKIRAVKDAPTPRSVPELRAYLGLLTYYGKFLPQLATTLHPLYRLLRKDVVWNWSTAEEEAFNNSKALLTSSRLLVHFDSSLPLILACDASAYGIGAVLAHRMPDGSERPIGYASRTLSKAEQNYSQLEKEGLSCVFGVKKFHSYLFGHVFELITDNKPLLGLLKEDRAAPQQSSARVKRWSLFLSTYEYKLTFRDTKAHANADAISRLPLRVVPSQAETPPELVLLAEHLQDSPVTAKDIRTWSRKDSQLSKVLQFVMHGWPSSCSQELEHYSNKKSELSLFDGCLLWGSRVVVPPQGREAVLQELHEGHPGISKMKALARMYVWWPGIDVAIEKSVHTCNACQENQAAPPRALLNPWKWPTRPWSRLHLDFAGPFENRMFLILIDAHSKWIEAICTANATSATVIIELCTIFARFGLPDTIVTDNGTSFVSEEFVAFLSENGVKHLTSAPYHPASNGLAERAVQIVKQGLRKVKPETSVLV